MLLTLLSTLWKALWWAWSALWWLVWNGGWLVAQAVRLLVQLLSMAVGPAFRLLGSLFYVFIYPPQQLFLAARRLMPAWLGGSAAFYLLPVVAVLLARKVRREFEIQVLYENNGKRSKKHSTLQQEAFEARERSATFGQRVLRDTPYALFVLVMGGVGLTWTGLAGPLLDAAVAPLMDPGNQVSVVLVLLLCEAIRMASHTIAATSTIGRRIGRRILRTLFCTALVVAILTHRDVDGDGDVDLMDSSAELANKSLRPGDTAWQLAAGEDLGLYLDLASPRVGAMLAFVKETGGRRDAGNKNPDDGWTRLARLGASVFVAPDLHVYQQAANRYPSVIGTDTTGDGDDAQQQQGETTDGALGSSSSPFTSSSFSSSPASTKWLQGSAFKGLALTVLLGTLLSFLKPVLRLFTGTAPSVGSAALKAVKKAEAGAKAAEKLGNIAGKFSSGRGVAWAVFRMSPLYSLLCSLLKELLVRVALWLVLTKLGGTWAALIVSLVAVAAADRIMWAAAVVREEGERLIGLVGNAMARIGGGGEGGEGGGGGVKEE